MSMKKIYVNCDLHTHFKIYTTKHSNTCNNCNYQITFMYVHNNILTHPILVKTSHLYAMKKIYVAVTIICILKFIKLSIQIHEMAVIIAYMYVHK